MFAAFCSYLICVRYFKIFPAELRIVLCEIVKHFDNFHVIWFVNFSRRNHRTCGYFQEQICVRQITFDIEHYMEETIRGRAEWGDRYIAFTNYDLQVLDVSIVKTCPRTKHIFLML